jgi:hypothetical protein
MSLAGGQVRDGQPSIATLLSMVEEIAYGIGTVDSARSTPAMHASLIAQITSVKARVLGSNAAPPQSAESHYSDQIPPLSHKGVNESEDPAPPSSGFSPGFGITPPTMEELLRSMETS